MDFKSYSQAGQDMFVFKTLVEPTGKLDGTFLDIGASHPTEISNTYALEQLGWRGFLIEQDPTAAQMLREGRRSTVMEANAQKINWRNFPQKHFDYISLDVDHISHGVLLEMLVAGVFFRVATVEHNQYNYPAGDGPEWASRALLEAKGYDLICKDVTNEGHSFEDWWADSGAITGAGRAVLESMRGGRRDGKKIVGL